MDFNSALINAIFNVGTTSTTINVPVTKDNIVEKSETFNLNFNIPSSLSGQVTPGTITKSLGNIIDNTGKIKLLVNKFNFIMLLVTTMRFTQSAYSVDENNGPVQPVLVLSNPSSTDITVQVFNINITAFGGCYNM